MQHPQRNEPCTLGGRTGGLPQDSTGHGRAPRTPPLGHEDRVLRPWTRLWKSGHADVGLPPSSAQMGEVRPTGFNAEGKHSQSRHRPGAGAGTIPVSCPVPWRVK